MDLAAGEGLGEMDGACRGSVTREFLATTYLNRVHRFAVMVCPPGADPDDLTQQAMLRAMERVGQFDPGRGTLEAWLWRIVANVARDAGRLSRRKEFLAERMLGDLRTGGGVDSPEALALERIRDQELIAAVRGLPRRYRTLIALRYGAGLRSTEIAELLGTSRMAVVKATRRALDRLRTELSQRR